MRAGLERGDTEIAARREPVPCGDAACWRDAVRASGATVAVVATVAIVERDYNLRIIVPSYRSAMRRKPP